MVPIQSHFFLAILAALTTLHFQATASPDLASSPPDGATVLACVGQDAKLEWNFTLEDGDRVQDIRWYVADGVTTQMIATFIDGTFFPMPGFSGRLRHLGNATLVLDNVTIEDKAHYSVDADIHLASGVYAKQQNSVHLKVAAPPVTKSGKLEVSQGRHAVYSTMTGTGTWHVQLTCGVFTDRGYPEEDVQWKTPSGSFQPSSNYDNGYFQLLLVNPVEGGNYSCRINSSSLAAACSHSDVPMMQEVKVTVDEVKARLTLIEASQNETKQENADLKKENANLTQRVFNLESQLDQYYGGNVTNTIPILQGKASAARVSFHARLSSRPNVSSLNDVILALVYTNEGGAYSDSTGRFTVPRDGTYAFFASVGTGSASTPFAAVKMMVDNTDVCLSHSYYSGSAQGSSCHAVLHLKTGQRVWLRAREQSYYWGEATVFSGFLLSADEQ